MHDQNLDADLISSLNRIIIDYIVNVNVKEVSLYRFQEPLFRLVGLLLKYHLEQ